MKSNGETSLFYKIFFRKKTEKSPVNHSSLIETNQMPINNSIKKLESYPNLVTETDTKMMSHIYNVTNKEKNSSQVKEFNSNEIIQEIYNTNCDLSNKKTEMISSPIQQSTKENHPSANTLLDNLSNKSTMNTIKINNFLNKLLNKNIH